MAPELRIQDMPIPAASSTAAPTPATRGQNAPEKTYQQIEATGPGSIHMTNKTTGKQNVHAFWNERIALHARLRSEPGHIGFDRLGSIRG